MQHSQARLRAVSAPHSSDWLNALPISSCGLRLDDEAIRVAVGFRLGAKLCETHACPCGIVVDQLGAHSLSCKRSAGRSSRHHQLNDLIWRALSRADVPSLKEPVGLLRTDGKRPDGVTQVPWRAGKCVTWDVTVADTLAQSYIRSTAAIAGSAAEGAATRKQAKYSSLTDRYAFVPLAFETLGPPSSECAEFISELGRRIATVTANSRETAFLWQRLSIAIQRYNSICFSGTLNSFRE